jgi:hypothetical protein
MAELKSTVLKPAAVCFDFKAFFHQFALDPACALYFALRTGNGTYVPTTVPTGAMQPPLFAQILMNALCAAIQSVCPSVEANGFIDNLRLAGETTTLLAEATTVMRHLLKRIGITPNEKEDRSPCYTFLGITFNHTTHEVSLSTKTIHKLEHAMLQQTSAPTARSAILAMFGTCVWASGVLAVPRYDYYYVYKFIRRRSRGYMGDLLHIWPSILPLWRSWTSLLAANRPVTITRELAQLTYTLVTDSSSTGWGGCCFTGTGTGGENIVGANWSASDQLNYKEKTSHLLAEVGGQWQLTRHINFTELQTVRLAVEALHISSCTLDVFVDNTSTKGMLRRMDSGVYVYNRELKRLGDTLRRKNISLRDVNYVHTLFNHADDISRGRAPRTTHDIQN